MKRIFLNGGGGAADSIYLDRKFASELDTKKPLIYIPIAMEPERWDNCSIWIRSVFFPLGVKKIEILTDLNDVNEKALDDSAGIYIGGGDTVKLLREICKTGFDQYLKKYTARGKPIYGGSAGAIILGKDIRTAPEAKCLDEKSSTGLNILFGFSVYCHYVPSQKQIVKGIQKALKCPLIVLPENSGVFIKDNEFEVLGLAPAYIFTDKKEFVLQAQASEPYKLSDFR